ncbi:hypothetical protein [Moraxella lacunata]|uniref:hypothetical protein n=1 Tax=Moraxella lacunata TaxID=477 RepID=UPI003EE03E56
MGVLGSGRLARLLGRRLTCGRGKVMLGGGFVAGTQGKHGDQKGDVFHDNPYELKRDTSWQG